MNNVLLLQTTAELSLFLVYLIFQFICLNTSVHVLWSFLDVEENVVEKLYYIPAFSSV